MDALPFKTWLVGLVVEASTVTICVFGPFTQTLPKEVLHVAQIAAKIRQNVRANSRSHKTLLTRVDACPRTLLWRLASICLLPETWGLRVAVAGCNAK
eukprot:4710607-Amphidinium_carterae.2